MVETALVNPALELGEKAYATLKDDGVLGLRAALWWYDVDASEWRFLVAATDCETRGPRAAYLRIRNLLKRADLLDELPLSRVVVVPPGHHILKSLHSAFNLSAPRPLHLSLQNITIPDLHIDGAYVYDA